MKNVYQETIYIQSRKNKCILNNFRKNKISNKIIHDIS
jgi:hypothetical protein